MGSIPQKLHQPLGVNEWLNFTGAVGCAGFLLTQPVRSRSRGLGAAGGAKFLERLFDRFAGLARALLNPANQFFLLAFGESEIVIRELGPFLF